MPNTIALAKNYTDLLDEVYKNASVTADLTSPSNLVRAGANANEIIYPQIDVTGLGGYTDGSNPMGMIPRHQAAVMALRASKIAKGANGHE